MWKKDRLGTRYSGQVKILITEAGLRYDARTGDRI